MKLSRGMVGVTGVLLASGCLLGGCGSGSSTGGGGDGDGDGDVGSGDGDAASGDGDGDVASGDGDGDSTTDGITIIQVPQIPGGGSNAAPLSPGCGPETAQDCTAPGGGCDNGELLSGGSVKVHDAGAVCFYGEGMENPSATVEHITESVNGQEYVHLRVIFDPNFVDTVYGECSAETGWGAKGHKFGDLVGSDHTELILYNCDGEMSMHVKVDFLSKDADSACGFSNLGVTGGDGKVIVGDAEHVLAVGTSLDRNLNGCGYCDDEMADSGGMGGPGSGTAHSPCPSGDGYEPSAESPEWDFRMVYELWIDPAAFGSSGFCHPDIEYVHASPAKSSNDTILVEPDDCPPPPGGDCPPNYELYLSSEGEYLCAGPPNDGDCADGYELDLTSEGELCIPAGQQ
jgi:hypothetical protein